MGLGSVKVWLKKLLLWFLWGFHKKNYLTGSSVFLWFLS